MDAPCGRNRDYFARTARARSGSPPRPAGAGNPYEESMMGKGKIEIFMAGDEKRGPAEEALRGAGVGQAR